MAHTEHKREQCVKIARQNCKTKLQDKIARQNCTKTNMYKGTKLHYSKINKRLIKKKIMNYCPRVRNRVNSDSKNN